MKRPGLGPRDLEPRDLEPRDLEPRGQRASGAPAASPGAPAAPARRNRVAALAALKELDPRYVVAGHKYPGHDGDPASVDEPIACLTDFADAEARTATPAEPYQAMLSRHGRRANPGPPWGAAKRCSPHIQAWVPDSGRHHGTVRKNLKYSPLTGLVPALPQAPPGRPRRPAGQPGAAS